MGFFTQVGDVFGVFVFEASVWVLLISKIRVFFPQTAPNVTSDEMPV